MNNIKNFLIIAILSLVLAGCYKDNGNYDYTEIEGLTIRDINGTYTLVSGIDKLNITPRLEGATDDMKLGYTWCVYNSIENSINGDTLPYNTLSLEDVVLTYPAGNYDLVLTVSDLEHGLTYYARASIEIITEYSNGFYVLKEMDGDTELDYYNQTTLVPNILMAINREPLEGKPVAIKYQQIHNYLDNFNEIHREAVFFVQSEYQTKAYRIADMVKTRDYYDCFYKKQHENGRQINIFSTFYNLNIVDEGGVYSLLNSSAVGKFGMPRTNEKKYLISDKGFSKTMMQFLVYDDLNGRYLNGYNTNNILSEYQAENQYNIDVAPYGLNYTLAFMGFCHGTTMSGDTYAVLDSKSAPRERVIHTIDIANIDLNSRYGLRNPIKKVYRVDPASKFYQSELICNNRDISFLYFALENKVYYYSVTNGIEELIHTFDEGETVTHINHLYSTSGYSFNGLTVATHKDGRYKVYQFKLIGGKISDEEPETFEGEGIVKEVIYVSIKSTSFSGPYR